MRNYGWRLTKSLKPCWPIGCKESHRTTKQRRSAGNNLPGKLGWARICNRLWSPGIDSDKSIPSAYVARRAGTKNKVFVLARQAVNRFLGSSNGIQIRALAAGALGPNSWKQWSLSTVVFSSCFWKEISRVIDWLREMKNAHQWELEENSWRWNNIGGFIKDEYCSWVQYKSGPGGEPSM
jgi:hypothetical protein